MNNCLTLNKLIVSLSTCHLELADLNVNLVKKDNKMNHNRVIKKYTHTFSLYRRQFYKQL